MKNIFLFYDAEVSEVFKIILLNKWEFSLLAWLKGTLIDAGRIDLGVERSLLTKVEVTATKVMRLMF